MANELKSCVTKLPEKYADCITGDEIDNIDNELTDSNTCEIPAKHFQCDNKINNEKWDLLDSADDTIVKCDLLDSADDTIVKCDLLDSAYDTIVKRPTTDAPILNITKSKSCEDLQQITSTPIRVSSTIFGKLNHDENSPKHRVMQHSKMMDSKLEDIHTSLSTMDLTMKHFVEKLNDINMATMKTPDALSAKISEMLNNHKSKVTESLSTIKAKINHCATGIDALQTKANVTEGVVKDLKANQVEQKSL
ncbi:unnamed protein product [Mytilus coruscus]|uniref:Uncharacterized protein n=1 Tax=Mytilus coruscus TaxID=42192 RepID=A0A6J8AZ19_MYTCO|nr:unnamed protein product [Mytilus coruscus]